MHSVPAIDLSAPMSRISKRKMIFRAEKKENRAIDPLPSKINLLMKAFSDNSMTRGSPRFYSKKIEENHSLPEGQKIDECKVLNLVFHLSKNCDG